MEQRDCFLNEEEFNLFLDGELGGERTTVLKNHLPGCRDCTMQFDIASELKSALRQSRDDATAPAWLKDRILSSIRKEQPVRSGAFWESLRNLFSGRPLVPVSIASLLIIVLASAIYYGRPGNGNMPFIKELVHEHYEYLEEAIDLGIKSSDPLEISGWISSNAGMKINLPSGSQFPVPSGACVLEYEGDMMGYVFFDTEDKRVSLFMLDDNYEALFGQKTMRLENISLFCGTCTGMNYVLWKNSNLICVLVGDLPQASLVEMAKGFI